MHVAHIISGLDVSAGGPSRTVTQLCSHLADQRIDTYLISQRLRSSQLLLPDSPRVSNRIGLAESNFQAYAGLPGWKELRKLSATTELNVIHSHGVWHPLNHWASATAMRRNVPLVIQPRGMLEPWALRWHGRRKMAAMTLYQRKDLAAASVLVATSEQEAENLRHLGLKKPIATLPNGIVTSPPPPTASANPANPIRRALFLSRIHPKKGLINLLRAWARVKPENWELAIAGPDEDGHLKAVLDTAKSLRISESVKYIGEIEDSEKWAIYRQAQLFMLPTLSENFGVVVPEALSQGVPVITTNAAPWSDLVRYRCGWWVEPTEDHLSLALKEATQTNPTDLADMGRRGIEYARRYNWETIAEQMKELYEHIVSGKKTPSPHFLSNE